MSNKVGRPKKSTSKNYQYRLRLSFEDISQLEYLQNKTGKTIADLLRKGIDMQYNLEKIKG